MWIRITAVALIATLTAGAQQALDPWERVRLIEPGRRVQVVRTDGKSFEGAMKSWTADGLSVEQRGNKVRDVPKAEVARVAMVGGMSRAKRAGYGAAIGGAIGFAVYAALCAGAGGCDFSPALVGAAGGVFIGGVAAGIAALFPRHKEVIYRKP